jgi:hypothetical protein
MILIVRTQTKKGKIKQQKKQKQQQTNKTG